VRAGVVHQDATHHLRGKRKEVPTVVPVRPLTYQAQIRFVNQRGRLQGVTCTFASKIRRRLSLQFLIHQRQ
jgi:hypothetical protein